MGKPKADRSPNEDLDAVVMESGEKIEAWEQEEEAEIQAIKDQLELEQKELEESERILALEQEKIHKEQEEAE